MPDSKLDKKIRVLHVLDSDRFSGAENVAITIIKSMDSSVVSAYASHEGPIEEVLKEKGIPFYPLHGRKPSELKRVIHEFKPDLIHAHDFKAGMLAAAACGKIPVVNHLHHNSPWIKKRGLRSIAYRLCSGHIDRVLTVSQSVMDEYVYGDIFRKKTVVLDNPFDAASIRRKAEEGEGLKEGIEIAFLGRLSEPKNPLEFVSIVEKIREKNPNIHAVMIGDGPMREEVEKEIKSLGLEDTITLLGFQANPYPYIKAASLLIMPSRWEGFGLAALEAMALGLPVLAAPVGGLQNIVNESCGKLCKTREEYAVEAERLLLDSEYHQMKSDGAKKRAMDYDNLKQYSEKLLSIYQEVTRGSYE